jgi:hypothetical protein
VTAGRGGFHRVKDFGINFGYERVVIYVEPIAGPGQVVTPNTTRTEILIDGEPLPWDRIAAEFEERMPEELRAFQEAIAAGSSSKDHRKAIRERLAQIAELFRIPRYRPARAGERELDEPSVGGAPAERKQRKRRTAKPGTSGGKTGNVYALFQRPGGPNREDVDPKALPDIHVDWVSVEDGTRTPPYLEDRAAHYDQRHNRLEINADFRGYVDMLRRWRRRYGKVAGAQAFITDTVAQWFEQALTETVLGVLALRGSEYWAEQAVADALSEEALSAAVMQRYHLDVTLRRELATKLGLATRAA